MTPDESDEVNRRRAVRRRFRAKLLEWLSRYGVAECAGIGGALLGAILVRDFTGNALAAAYGGSWGETLGYASVIITRDYLIERRALQRAQRTFSLRDAARLATALLAEFGPAGALDSLVTRPLAMGIGTRLFGITLGVVLGKLTADIVFYIPVVLMYERRKRRRQHREGGP
jgi:hypothetical protein